MTAVENHGVRKRGWTAAKMRGNAFRAALTMLGVIIGVAAVIAMLALGRGAQAAVDEQLATLGADVLTVTTGMRWLGGVARDQQTLTLDDAAALARDARHVAAVVPEHDTVHRALLRQRPSTRGHHHTGAGREQLTSPPR